MQSTLFPVSLFIQSCALDLFFSYAFVTHLFASNQLSQPIWKALLSNPAQLQRYNVIGLGSNNSLPSNVREYKYNKFTLSPRLDLFFPSEMNILKLSVQIELLVRGASRPRLANFSSNDLYSFHFVGRLKSLNGNFN